MIEQQLLDAFVAVLACRVDRREAAALAEVRIGTVLQRELHELVPHRLVLPLRSGSGVNGRGLDVLVSREGIHVRAAFEQETRRVDMPEEAGEAERVKAVVAECVRTRRVLVEQLAEPVRAADRRRLEDVEARVGGEQLVHRRPVAPVQRFAAGSTSAQQS